jgi:hypothetical protein
MRVRTLQAASTLDSLSGPRPGDVCVGCVHEPNPHGCHYYYVGISFRTPDGRTGESSWLLMCDACFMKHGETIRDDLGAGKFPIGCDMVWPEDMRIQFPKN